MSTRPHATPWTTHIERERLKKMIDPWVLVYNDFDPADEGRRETLCAVGNGYWATRGAAPGSVADETHYPGTYFAGVYNRVVTDFVGRRDESEHMVNAPDWTFLSIAPEHGPILHPGAAEMLSHRQELDLRHGILTRTNRYRDSHGRTTRIDSRVFLSLAHTHLGSLETTVVAEDWSGEVAVVSAVNGTVANRNSAGDSHLVADHLTPMGGSILDEETVLWESRTIQSGISIAMAMRTLLFDDAGDKMCGRYRKTTEAGRSGYAITLPLERGRAVTIAKTVAVATSRDRALSTAALSASQGIRDAPEKATLLDAHVRAWDDLWDRFNIQLSSGRRHSQALNVNTFHVLACVGTVGTDLDAGVPARGLSGEGYRGHIFWDELFIYPMLTLRRPDITRSLLLYRYRRLGAARAAARSERLEGALFPWQSGSDGQEETPTALFNVRDQQWMPDNSHRQRHVGLAVAYSVWQYYQASGDLEFLVRYGTELLVEISRCFAAMAKHDPTDDSFSISGVMGPDEFHDGYPNHPGEGLRNNAYTNVLSSWVLAKSAEAVALVSAGDGGELRRRMGLTTAELAHWDRVSRRLRVLFHADGVISQFEGYEALKEFDWSLYRARYGDIGRLDLILQAEGDTTNGYKLSKQADVLMLFYLLSAEELRGVFHRLGYPLAPEIVPQTVSYYLSRTSHGSTLSRLAHSWVLARSDREQSWSLFTKVLECDIADTPGGTTQEGVHLGAMAGTSDMVLRCYGGVETRHDTLWLHPLLPLELSAVTFRLYFRGQAIKVHITSDSIALHLAAGRAEPIKVRVENVQRTLAPGDSLSLLLASGECTVVRN